MSMSVNNVLSNYTYTYQSERRPILDQNYDSVWSKDEVSKYAEDYKAATGTSLDVDAIFKQYDKDSSGALEFAEYETAADNDAFGISLLSQKQAEANSQLGSSANQPENSNGVSSNTSINAQASAIKSTATLDDVLADYTYSYKGDMQVILDQNYDGAWSADEVAQYAADYKSATGTQLDADAIFKQYDADGNNALEYSEYENARANDAFGASLLSQKKAEANSSLGVSQGSSLGALNGTQSSEKSEFVEEIPPSLSDWLQSLGNTTRTALVNNTVWADNTSNLLNTMLSVNNSYSGIGYGLMQYTNINSYANAAYQASTLFMNA